MANETPPTHNNRSRGAGGEWGIIQLMFSFIKKFFRGTLHKACEKGNIEAVKQHLADGADVNGKDDSYGGGTPLHMATIQDRKEVAELLIAKGSDVNAMDNDDQTPLDWTIGHKHPELADLLRRHSGKHGTIHSAIGGGDVDPVTLSGKGMYLV